MRLKSLFNHVEKNKSFVYQDPHWDDKKQIIIVPISPRKNGHPICSGCNHPAPGYDRLAERTFHYVPLWNIPVDYSYAMRRVNCPTCGVKVESVPWAVGQSSMTKSLMLFLAAWAKLLSWSDVARRFGQMWHQVYRSVEYVVEYGLKHRDLSNVTAIGVDEWQYKKGHNYLTLVYQINAGYRRLLYIGKDRQESSLMDFFRAQGENWCQKIEYVCSDLWKPYLKAIREGLSEAVHILDRFHIVMNLNKALNSIRAKEARQMEADGYEEILKKTKYCFLKRPENLTEKQEVKLKDVLKYDLKSVRAYLLKESFQALWTYTSPHWARWYLRKWCNRAMLSKLKPIKTFVKSMRKHEDLIMNWFSAKKQLSSGIVEGLNRKINLVTRKSYGFRSEEILKIALFHTIGDLPEPESTHKFL